MVNLQNLNSALDSLSVSKDDMAVELSVMPSINTFIKQSKSEIERIMEQPANIHNQNNLEDLRALIGNLETVKNNILNGRNKQASLLLNQAIKKAEKIRI
ncbi:hypothetical protein J4405_06105 [Candidatus Woesearchaeota archaeon]|nr:hypothetical protein [Candidatus Woesearchaeota archaeon]